MPQTTIAYARANANGGGLGAAWTALASSLTPDGTTTPDDNVDSTATGTVSGVTGVQTLTFTTFHMLVEETGSIFSGLKVPAGASILGVRIHTEMICSGSGPSMVATSNGGGAGVTFTGTTRTVVTQGYGTLSAGSTAALGNTFAGNNLGTEAGQAAARSALSDASISVLLTGGAGTVAGTAPTYKIDYAKLEVSWVVRLDVVGGGRASASVAGGSLTAAVQTAKTAAEGGRGAASVGGATDHTIITEAGGGKAGFARAGGQPHPQTNNAGGARAASATAGGQPHPQTNSPGGPRATSTAGGVARVFSYAIFGYSRVGATNALLAGVRVDVYRTSDHAHMGRVTSDSGAYYVVAIPHTGNEIATFWSRFFLAGTPDEFATTDEDLPLIQTQVQGPNP